MGDIINLAARRAERTGRQETRESLLAMAKIWESSALVLEDMCEDSQNERSQAFRCRMEAAKLA